MSILQPETEAIVSYIQTISRYADSIRNDLSRLAGQFNSREIAVMLVLRTIIPFAKAEKISREQLISQINKDYDTLEGKKGN